LLEKTNRVNILYDFYGSLLTKRQQQIIELYYQHNLSLGEIAEEYKISRQAVYDLMNRAVKTLERFEEKLQLYKKHQVQRDKYHKLFSYLESNERIEKEKIKNILTELWEL